MTDFWPFFFFNKKCYCTDPSCYFPNVPSQIWPKDKQFALCNFIFEISNFGAFKTPFCVAWCNFE